VATTSIFIQFSKLAATGQDGVVVARLALVVNDMAEATSAMQRLDEEAKPSTDYLRKGAKICFARLQCGHLSEGLKPIREIKNNPRLTSVVERCAPATQKSFQDVVDCLPGGTQHREFKAFVTSVRNKVAFHYDPSDVEWAIGDRASNGSANLPSLTIGEDIHSCRYEFADQLLWSIVCRKLWAIPRSADVLTEADRISGWCFQKCLSYLRFTDEFLLRFLRERGVVL